MSSPEDGVGDGGEPVQVTMAKIFSSIVFSCVVLGPIFDENEKGKNDANGSVLSSFQCETNPSKKASEKFIFVTSALWIVSIIIVIAFELYEQFTRWHYIMYCGSCAVPYILYPIWRPFEEDTRKTSVGKIYRQSQCLDCDFLFCWKLRLDALFLLSFKG